MAIRQKDHAFRDSLQTLLDRKKPQIDSILQEYGVPVFPVKTEAKKDEQAKGPPAPASPATTDSTQASKR